MNRVGIAIGGILLLILAVAVYFISQTNPTPPANLPASKDDLIILETPLPNGAVQSPLTISGQARGNWYFEASFPARLYDANGVLLAEVPAQAQGDWMTTEYVPFIATLTFDAPTTATGLLVLEKDNASGLPEHANQMEVPVRFAEVSTGGMGVQLFFYNPDLDQGPGGVQCTSLGLVAVERTIPRTTTPLTDTIRLLLRGELTAAERARGITTEFPLAGVTLTSAAIENSVATLTFDDPQNKTGGGSCRVGILWAQIEATAKQFPTVDSAVFMPEELFQP